MEGLLSTGPALSSLVITMHLKNLRLDFSHYKDRESQSWAVQCSLVLLTLSGGRGSQWQQSVLYCLLLVDNVCMIIWERSSQVHII